MSAPIIAANWKMNTTISEATSLAQNIDSRLENISGVKVLIFPPFMALSSVKNALDNSHIEVGAQNMYFRERGAYTGEISPYMVAELCEWVILGHSERRLVLGETGTDIALKIRAALEHSIKPILCVGETLSERESKEAENVIREQLSQAVEHVDIPDGLVIAYEPVWAIGTGLAATPLDAQSMMVYLRHCLTEKFGEYGAKNIPILYGGSVTAENISGLLIQKDIDGALVGGASLNPDSFVDLVHQAAYSN